MAIPRVFVRGVGYCVLRGACAIAVLGASAASADVVIRSAGAEYRTDAAPSGGADLSLSEALPAIPDFLDQQWWWWRSDIGPGYERALARPDSVSMPSESRAELAWLGLESSPFAARLTIDVGRRPYLVGGYVNQRLTVTNTDAVAHEFVAFHYLDFSVESAWGIAPISAYGGLTHIEFYNLPYIMVGTLRPSANAGAFEVGEAGTIGPLLNDEEPTELNNMGLPFGWGDLSLAYQWSVLLGSGESAEFELYYEQFIPAPATLFALMPLLLAPARRRAGGLDRRIDARSIS